MRVALPLFTMMIGGCGESEHSRYYVLPENPVSDYRAVTVRPVTIALGAVKLPPALDRPQMARRLGSGEIFYSEFDRWAGSLDETVRQVLIADLDGLLPSGVVLIENDTANPARLTISVDILRIRRGRNTARSAPRTPGDIEANQWSGRSAARCIDRRARGRPGCRGNRRHDEPRGRGTRRTDRHRRRRRRDRAYAITASHLPLRRARQRRDDPSPS